MQEVMSPLRMREGIHSNALERRDFLRLATIGGVSLSCVGQVGEALAQREVPRGKITPTHMPEELLRDGIPLSDGGVATVEDCPVAGAEQRLIILREIHTDSEYTSETARLVSQSRKEIGDVMKFLLNNYGVNCYILEGFTVEDYSDFRELLAEMRKVGTLNSENKKRFNEILKGLGNILPEASYELFKNNQIFLLPWETREMNNAAINAQKDDPDYHKIVCDVREDSCIDIQYKSRVKVAATLCGGAHFMKNDDGEWGDLPLRILNRNIRDFGVLSASFVTIPTVIEYFWIYKKKGKLHPSHEYIFENLKRQTGR